VAAGPTPPGPARAGSRRRSATLQALPERLGGLVDELLAAIGPTENRDQVEAILATAVALALDHPARLDLKITNAALAEMTEAFRVFAPYRHVPKVTMFGSARTRPEDPLYAQARTLAARLAAAGWMVVTGAGPGIMAAGLEGAGREHSFGINIRLPFEQGASPLIAEDPKLVEMKYFFTRKLMLVKESAGYAVLPGGFGTQDEAFELLTLVQTGKADPVPIVLVDVPGGTYWHSWQRFVDDELVAGGLVSPGDRSLYRITDSVEDAVAELLGFYRNYHSRRFVGNTLVLRLRRAPDDHQLAQLGADFADIADASGLQRSEPLPIERAEGDHLELDRVVLRFDRIHQGRLRELIDALNATLPAAPDGAPPAAPSNATPPA